MQPAVSPLHQQLIDAFGTYGGYDASVIYIRTPERDYRVNGMKNAAHILGRHRTWDVATKHLGVILTS